MIVATVGAYSENANTLSEMLNDGEIRRPNQWEIISGACPELSGTQWSNKPEFCPTLSQVAEPDSAVMDALAAHTVMSKQALDSERVREGLKDVLLGPGQLYEALRQKTGEVELGPDI